MVLLVVEGADTELTEKWRTERTIGMDRNPQSLSLELADADFTNPRMVGHSTFK
jgi:hypothetical protein